MGKSVAGMVYDTAAISVFTMPNSAMNGSVLKLCVVYETVTCGHGASGAPNGELAGVIPLKPMEYRLSGIPPGCTCGCRTIAAIANRLREHEGAAFPSPLLSA